MDEREALAVVSELLDGPVDDAVIIDGHVLCVDMLHETSDLPTGVSPYTTGWRTVAVSLSDLAAMGARPVATLAVYSPPSFDRDRLEAFLEGAIDATTAVGGRYLGGDLDVTDELTTVGVALGEANRPMRRRGASPGDLVVVTGALGRGALAVRRYRDGLVDEAERAFRIDPRIEAGRALASAATAMIDSSDGLARSVHLLAAAGDVGIDLDGDAIPLVDGLEDVLQEDETWLDLGVYWGEDFELVATVPPDRLDAVRERTDTTLSVIGRVTAADVTLDGHALPDRGYDHA